MLFLTFFSRGIFCRKFKKFLHCSDFPYFCLFDRFGACLNIFVLGGRNVVSPPAPYFSNAEQLDLWSIYIFSWQRIGLMLIFKESILNPSRIQKSIVNTEIQLLTLSYGGNTWDLLPPPRRDFEHLGISQVESFSGFGSHRVLPSYFVAISVSVHVKYS